jgi:hypothetical protein
MNQGTRVETASWLTIAAIAIAVAIGMAFRGLSFDWPSAAAPVAGCLALTALVAGYRYRDERVAVAFTATLQLVAFTAVGAPLSYLAAGAARPLWDATFLAWDQSLGLDWRAYLAFVDAHPAIGTLYNLAYRSIIQQMIVAATVLGLTGRIAETRGFVGAVIFSALSASWCRRSCRPSRCSSTST